MVASVNLVINFFHVPMSGKEITLLIRDLEEGEVLREHEHLLKRGGRIAVITDTVDSGTAADYRTAPFSLADLDSYIVRKLIENGLAKAISENGFEVERRIMSFSCYRSDDNFTDGIPPFLILKRGVTLTVESVVKDHLEYGFFASMKVRRTFTIDLHDSELASAAKGKSVDIGGRMLTRGTLLDVDTKTCVAKIQVDGTSHDIPFRDVHVPCSNPILSSYCAVKHMADISKVIKFREQVARYTMQENHRKDRLWLRKEFDFVQNWLIASSSVFSTQGRISFYIPNSDQCVYLDTQPCEVDRRAK